MKPAPADMAPAASSLPSSPLPPSSSPLSPPGQAGLQDPRWRTVAVFSRGLIRIPHLAALLGAEQVLFRPGPGDAARIDAIVGWGNKQTAERARAYARQHGRPYWRAEDGFLRSIGLGRGGASPLSVVLDDQGIYYDARTPSRLEAMLNGEGDAGRALEDPALLDRAQRAMQRIVEAGLSKYNDSPPALPRLRDNGGRPRVLVVDQTAGDLSIVHGLADTSSFARMLDAALCEHPDAEILVKTHPDVIAGHRRGCVPAVLRSQRVRVLTERANPVALVQQVDHVYVVTSQLGFEALMAGTPVTTFGAPFYAGWGLTDDRQPHPRRRQRRRVEQIFAAAYLLYARYLDPESGRSGTIETVIDHLTCQREGFAANQGTLFCFGFRAWKRGYVRAYLRCPGNRVVFARSAAHAERLGIGSGPDHGIVVWGQRAGADIEALAQRRRVPLWRMEDGFLRSVGLGSDMVTPASLVVDREGIYYDPRTPSELERILDTAAFSDGELARARALRDAMVRERLSKYNVGQPRRLSAPPGRRVILVPGQVEDDASILLGCPGIRGNEDLLRAVRDHAPEAYIIYKPHPDVVAGNRRGQVREPVARGLCDRVEVDAAIADCLEVAGEVHTMTSLVGFEALLRDLRVVTYGQPFYAGWGLTEDRQPLESVGALARRTRRLTLDELVAGVLIRYPRYLHPRTGAFTTPEAVLAHLREERARAGASTRLRSSRARRQIRKLTHIVRGLRGILDAS